MSVYTIPQYFAGNTYPGRGVLLGLTPDGQQAVAAYFIMGRSVNSRNRIFVPNQDSVQILPFDASLVSDPSLIIYFPIRVWGDQTIVTNGDQTDTIYQGLQQNETFPAALARRTYEPDAPNYTPRISGLLCRSPQFSYQLSILKRENESGACGRYLYTYEPTPGLGHLIHTYQQDGTPLPSFCGEPVALVVPQDIKECTQTLWDALDPENKVALAVRYLNLADGSYQQRIVNTHQEVSQ